MQRFVALLALVALAHAGDSLDGLKQAVQGEIEKNQQLLNEEKIKWKGDQANYQETINDLKEQIEDLVADMADFGQQTKANRSKKESHTTQKEEAQQKSADLNQQADKQKGENEKNQEEYDSLKKDLKESISALKRAISVLNEQAYDRNQSLMQIAKETPLEDGKRMIESLMSAPSGAAYEHQSGDIIDMCKQWLKDFEDKLDKASTEFRNKKQNGMMVEQDLRNQAAGADDMAAFHEQQAAGAEAAEGKFRGRYLSAQKEKEESEGTLTQTEAAFKQATTDYNDNVKSFEMQITDLKSAKVLLGKAFSFIQTLESKTNPKKSVSLLQVGLVDKRVAKALDLLEQKSLQIHSSVLSALALRVAENPLRKITDMINDLIGKLKKEAAEDQKSHGMCMAEMMKNRKELERTNSRKTDLMSEIASQESEMNNQQEEEGKQNDNLKENANTQRKRVFMRKESHEMNMEVIALAKKALKGLNAAHVVITTLVNKGSGTGKGSGGGQDALQTILSLIQKLIDDANSTQAKFEKKEETQLAVSNKLDMKLQMAQGEFETRKAEASSLYNEAKEKKLRAEQQQDDNQQLLDDALGQKDKLMPICAPPPVDLKERIAKRNAEIQSLKEVLEVLSDQ